jgi:hypothetical protein
MMERKIVVIKNPGQASPVGFIEEAFKANGWDLETIELSKGEPLPRSLEDVAGLLILNGPMNVYEQCTSPCMKVYFNS